MSHPTSCTLAEWAQDVGLSIHPIRFYARERLLKAPVRSDGRFRILGD